MIPALGGAERRLHGGRGANKATWTVDGKALVVSGIHFLNLTQVDTGESTRLALPLERKSHFHLEDPVFRPDGRELAFVVSDAVEGDSVYVVGWAAEGKVEGAGREVSKGRFESYRSLAWSGDGKSIFIADSQGGIAKLVRVSATGEGTPELMAGLGEHIVSVSAAGNRLVYGNLDRDFDLWRSEGGAETRILQSTRSERSPALSPDGKEIAFISDRSGESELWLANVDGSNARQLSKMAPVSGPLRWAPDSSAILFRANPVKGRAVYRIRRQGGSAIQIGPAGALHGQWMADGKSIIFSFSAVGDRYDLYRTDSEGKAPSVKIEGSEVGNYADEFRLSADGRQEWFAETLGIRSGLQGILRKQLPDGEPEVVAAPKGVRPVAFGMKGVHFVAVGSQILQFCDYETGKIKDVATVPEGFLPREGSHVGGAFTVSLDGKVLLYAKPAQTVSDLYLVEGVR